MKNITIAMNAQITTILRDCPDDLTIYPPEKIAENIKNSILTDPQIDVDDVVVTDIKIFEQDVKTALKDGDN